MPSTRHAAPVISAATFLLIEIVATAVLALWLVVRFPRFGPRSTRGTLAAVVAGLVALKLGGVGAGLVAGLSHGAYLVLFGCAFPAFLGAFLAACWLLRLFAGMLGGSGGGPGEPVPGSA